MLQCLSSKWIERFEKLKETFDPSGSFAKYRKLPTDAPCIPFVGVALKDLVFACEANSDRTEDGNGINFQKMRMIAEIINSLKVEQANQIDYSFLDFDPSIAQSILNATPMTQDELYARSKEISKQIEETNSSTDETTILKKRIEELLAEVEQLKEENANIKEESIKKDQLLFILEQQNKLQSKGKRRVSPHNIFSVSTSTSEPNLDLVAPETSKPRAVSVVERPGIRFG